jgi:hypothetical protein
VWGAKPPRVTDQHILKTLTELKSCVRHCSLDLHVCNIGDSPTFVRGASESFIDVTFASRALCQKVSNWRVLDVDSLSLHQYITFDISRITASVSQPPPTGWSWRKLDGEKLDAFLDSRPTTGFGSMDCDNTHVIKKL